MLTKSNKFKTINPEEKVAYAYYIKQVVYRIDAQNNTVKQLLLFSITSLVLVHDIHQVS